MLKPRTKDLLRPFRIVPSAPTVQRLVTAIGAVIVAWACAIALPAHAQAAVVPWSTVNPPASAEYCGPYTVRAYGGGVFYIKDCLVSARGGSYYQGVLEVEYHVVTGAAAGLGAKSMISRVGNPYALGVNDCPRRSWTYDQTRWCYSPTVRAAPGHKYYGKGALHDASRWIGVAWSPVKPDNPS